MRKDSFIIWSWLNCAVKESTSQYKQSPWIFLLGRNWFLDSSLLNKFPVWVGNFLLHYFHLLGDYFHLDSNICDARTWFVYQITLSPLCDCGLETDVGRKKAGWVKWLVYIPLKPSWQESTRWLIPASLPTFRAVSSLQPPAVTNPGFNNQETRERYIPLTRL